jgi:hypothetical protein
MEKFCERGPGVLPPGLAPGLGFRQFATAQAPVEGRSDPLARRLLSGAGRQPRRAGGLRGGRRAPPGRSRAESGQPGQPGHVQPRAGRSPPLRHSLFRPWPGSCLADADGGLHRRGLDGRSTGATAGADTAGHPLDVEADSWLTLWAAIAAYRQNWLGGVALLAPTLRYPLAVGRAGRLRPWQRAAGVTQMAVLCAALAPGPPARALARSLAPLAEAVQLLALARGNDGPGAREGVGIDDAHLADRLPLANDRGSA